MRGQGSVIDGRVTVCEKQTASSPLAHPPCCWPAGPALHSPRTHELRAALPHLKLLQYGGLHLG